jgi:hypothetical protein
MTNSISIDIVFSTSIAQSYHLCFINESCFIILDHHSIDIQICEWYGLIQIGACRPKTRFSFFFKRHFVSHYVT